MVIFLLQTCSCHLDYIDCSNRSLTDMPSLTPGTFTQTHLDLQVGATLSVNFVIAYDNLQEHRLCLTTVSIFSKQ